MFRFSFRRSSIALAGILIGIGGCAESPSAPVAAPDFHFLAAPAGPSMARAGEASSAVIGPEGGSLTTTNGHRIVFPAGALAAPTRISMSSNPRFAGVELEPHGLQFPAGHEPVLSLNLGATDLSGFSRVNVLYVGDDNAVLEVLPTSAGGQRIQTRLSHFSGYIGAGS
ncbi:MAG TPA: hypothetical protein VEX86_00525 [Longimicrobium sp.]|nr:hypothetical protein [Longimicrobium sp.]